MEKKRKTDRSMFFFVNQYKIQDAQYKGENMLQLWLMTISNADYNKIMHCCKRSIHFIVKFVFKLQSDVSKLQISILLKKRY